MILRQLLILAFLSFSFSQLSAQILSVESTENAYLDIRQGSDLNIFLVDVEDYLDWTFFVNSEEKILFVDFEAINGQIDNIKIVKDEDIRFSEDLSKLAPSSFYELSLANFEGGFYTILIETNTEVIAKELIIEK